ncbi:hypothetical protein PDTA9759_45930 [Phytobacter diazotrophicus]|uniref:Uncharacterized protein n=1 Tax=Phytobacter diazotrophicus TaxID=395631 RepID=A0ABM7W0P4_9ENTR|nr:hypothetical protein PDTA9734_45980 [Phytobacter diazotrophicus]BEG84039.1 hypothetical protein PDTA9730_44950 [Phytobacter diazotrophicus]BEG89937.1 hypothetical protein PDTA9759_45930 [Phytobacter diazotrophicus]BEG95701.1 hypothetical protein PDTA9832_45600 [Phytobacter diazotrophicus]
MGCFCGTENFFLRIIFQPGIDLIINIFYTHQTLTLTSSTLQLIWNCPGLTGNFFYLRKNIRNRIDRFTVVHVKMTGNFLSAHPTIFRHHPIGN